MRDYLERWLYDPVVGKLIAAAIGVVVIYVLVAFVHRAATRYVADSETRYRARKLTAFLGYVAGFLLLASIFSDRFGQLTVALGVAGAGIAFALQEVIASVAGWVAISFGAFYRPGDRVQVGGIKGDVIDVGVFRTTLMEVGQWVNADLFTGRIVRVANSFVFKEPVFNYSGDFPFLWDEVVLRVRYGSDYALARTILDRVGTEVTGGYAAAAKQTWEAIARKYRVEAISVEPSVTVTATDNWLEYTLRFIVDYRLRRTVKDRLFTRILEEIDKVSGQVNIASATWELSKLPPLQVQVTDARKPQDPKS
jgi:small-conductance mechanosensitive channel